MSFSHIKAFPVWMMKKKRLEYKLISLFPEESLLLKESKELNTLFNLLLVSTIELLTFNYCLMVNVSSDK